MYQNRTLQQYLLLLTILLTGHGVHAEEPAVLKKIRGNYTGTRTIYITFEQSIFWTIREKTTRKNGTLIIAPGNKFNVKFSDEVLVSDGTTYWQYSRKNNQVIIRKVKDLDLSSLPANILSSFLTRYTFRIKERKAKTTVLEWSDDTKDTKSYQHVSLAVFNETGIVQTLSFTGNNGNIHTYTFKKTEFDRAVPEKTFQFKAPADVNIVDNRS
jgi:outer membrane lipoprotein-sorting protein